MQQLAQYVVAAAQLGYTTGASDCDTVGAAAGVAIPQFCTYGPRSIHCAPPSCVTAASVVAHVGCVAPVIPVPLVATPVSVALV